MLKMLTFTLSNLEMKSYYLKMVKDMRHIINWFSTFAIILVAMFTACKEKEETSDPSAFTIDHNSIDALSIGGKTLINVSTDLSWNATVDDDWISLSPVSGNGSGIVNVEIGNHMGIRRSTKINFTAGAITKTIDVLQRGRDTARYLEERQNRPVKLTSLEGPLIKVFWGEPTPESVISELEYETTSGAWRKVTVQSTDTESECPDARLDAKYRTRSGFVASGTFDTLYKSWTTSKYPIYYAFPTGTLFVHPHSYRYDAITGAFTLPSSEYASSHPITVEVLEDGNYKVSDLFGGFYALGRDGYGDSYICYGVFNSEFSLVDSKTDPWGYGFIKLEGRTNLDDGFVVLDVYWNTGNYVFHLILCQDQWDKSGYYIVDNLPFRKEGKYELSALHWPGQLGTWGEKFGVLSYKVTVANSGKLKITDHKSPDRNIWFMLYNNKEKADKGDSDYIKEGDGTVEYDVTPGTYYVFGVMNTWYEDIAPLTSIDYDIEITLE
jgi:hypothetical protein